MPFSSVGPVIGGRPWTIFCSIGHNYEQALEAAHRPILPGGMGDSDYLGEEMESREGRVDGFDRSRPLNLSNFICRSWKWSV